MYYYNIDVDDDDNNNDNNFLLSLPSSYRICPKAFKEWRTDPQRRCPLISMQIW